MGDMQTVVSSAQALGVAGDRISGNPFYSYIAGPGGLIAGAAGAQVGVFAWVQPAPVDSAGSPQVVNNFGAGPVAGFVPRHFNAVITAYLAASGMIIPPGSQMSLITGGDYLAVNSGTNEALVGMKAYADIATGAVTFGATGAPGAGFGGTGSVAAGASSFTGILNGNVLTASAVTGLLVPGETIAGAGVIAGTQIVSQLDGTVHGAGNYLVSIGEQSVASEAMTGTYGLLTVTANTSPTLEVGEVLTGSGVTTGTTVTAFGTGVGGNGTYYVNKNTVVSSTADLATASTIETKWIAASTGLPGEPVKITSQPNG